MNLRTVGYVLLEGGAEFGGEMAAPDRRAIDLAGGFQALISIIPTAAAPDHNHDRAGRNGGRWFARLGARRVEVLPIIDRESANRPDNAEAVRASRLIYLLGGFTHYLAQTLKDSLCSQAMWEAYRAGAVIAGSSAGAMALCEHYYNPDAGQVVEGLKWIPSACVLPHHDTFGQGWAARLAGLLPNATLVGIDERTGTLNDGEDGRWSIYGRGAVTVYRGGRAIVYRSGDRFSLD